MSRRVVFDVNVLVSSVLSPSGRPAKAFAGALENGWDIGRSYHIVSKLIEVLGRPKFYDRLPRDRFADLLSAYQESAESYTPDPTVIGVAPDAEDDLVLGTAVAAKADFLVTGDKGMLTIGDYRGVRIVTAEEFLRELIRCRSPRLPVIPSLRRIPRQRRCPAGRPPSSRQEPPVRASSAGECSRFAAHGDPSRCSG